MVTRRRVWAVALGLCILGALICIGGLVWLQGVAWRIQGQHPPPVASRPEGQRWSEGELVFIGQLVCYLGMAIFLVLTALLAMLSQRLDGDAPASRSDTTDIWRRNVPPDDDPKALEDQWRPRGGPAENN